MGPPAGYETAVTAQSVWFGQAWAIIISPPAITGFAIGRLYGWRVWVARHVRWEPNAHREFSGTRAVQGYNANACNPKVRTEYLRIKNFRR